MNQECGELLQLGGLLLATRRHFKRLVSIVRRAARPRAPCRSQLRALQRRRVADHSIAGIFW